MAANKQTVSSGLAAFILSALTLGTFYTLREYGPESAIQHFHAAAIAGNIQDIQRYTMQSVDDRQVQQLAAMVRSIADQGGRPEVENVQREPRKVAVRIVYYSNVGPLQKINWIVEQTKASRWVVNATETRVGGEAGF